jgi:hypothetical protein
MREDIQKLIEEQEEISHEMLGSDDEMERSEAFGRLAVVKQLKRIVNKY